jgi:hypothetical protein
VPTDDAIKVSGARCRLSALLLLAVLGSYLDADTRKGAVLAGSVSFSSSSQSSFLPPSSSPALWEMAC